MDADTNDCIRITDVNNSDADNWPRSTTVVSTQTFPRVYVKVLEASNFWSSGRAAT
jgi:hypothetical protein